MVKTSKSHRNKAPSVGSVGEETLAQHIRAYKMPEPVREYRFHPERKWRFDFAWPEIMLAVEVDGMHPSGRHNTRDGIAADNLKRNTATEMGWQVASVTTSQVKSGYAVNLLHRLIARSSA